MDLIEHNLTKPKTKDYRLYFHIKQSQYDAHQHIIKKWGALVALLLEHHNPNIANYRLFPWGVSSQPYILGKTSAKA